MRQCLAALQALYFVSTMQRSGSCIRSAATAQPHGPKLSALHLDFPINEPLHRPPRCFRRGHHIYHICTTPLWCWGVLPKLLEEELDGAVRKPLLGSDTSEPKELQSGHARLTFSGHLYESHTNSVREVSRLLRGGMQSPNSPEADPVSPAPTRAAPSGSKAKKGNAAQHATHRTAILNDATQNAFCDNTISTSKYTMWSFVPRSLFEQ